MWRRIWCTYVQLIAWHLPMASRWIFYARRRIENSSDHHSLTHPHSHNWWDGDRIVPNMRRIRSKFISIVSISCPHRINTKPERVWCIQIASIAGHFAKWKVSCEKWLPSSSSSSSFRWIDSIAIATYSCQSFHANHCSLLRSSAFCQHTQRQVLARVCCLSFVGKFRLANYIFVLHEKMRKMNEAKRGR